MKQQDLLGRIDQDAVVSAIKRAEAACSGEVRVHLQPKATGGELQWVAERTFERLGMTKTAGRTGVLLFIASEEQRFVILGDKGIDEKVPPHFWEEVAERVGERFRSGHFTEGIVEAVDAVGEKLRAHFPRSAADVDELTNELSIDSHHDEKPLTK